MCKKSPKPKSRKINLLNGDYFIQRTDLMWNPFVVNKAQSFILFVISNHLQQQLEILKVKAEFAELLFPHSLIKLKKSECSHLSNSIYVANTVGYLKEINHLPVFLSASNNFKPQIRCHASMDKKGTSEMQFKCRCWHLGVTKGKESSEVPAELQWLHEINPSPISG